MRKATKFLLASLAALVFSSCSPDLSKPGKAVECFLKDVKRNENPMVRCGYTEQVGGVRYLDSGNKIDPKYYQEFGICAEDITKCMQFEGPLDNLPEGQHKEWKISLVITGEGKLPSFSGSHRYRDGSGITKALTENGTYPFLRFHLQQESNGMWRVANTDKSELYFRLN